MLTFRSLSLLPVCSMALVLSACAPRAADVPRSAADSQAAHIAEVVRAGGVVDSIRPIAEHLARFRAGTMPIDTLQHASPSIDALVVRLTKAVGRQDTAALAAMTLSRGEFAYLFYPESPLARPPYEAPPELLWGQIVASSDEGARQLVNRLGGASVRASGLHCPAAEPEGRNRLYKRCTVRLAATGRRALQGNLFGTILERDGRFKFVSLGNRI